VRPALIWGPSVAVLGMSDCIRCGCGVPSSSRVSLNKCACPNTSCAGDDTEPNTQGSRQHPIAGCLCPFAIVNSRSRPPRGQAGRSGHRADERKRISRCRVADLAECAEVFRPTSLPVSQMASTCHCAYNQACATRGGSSGVAIAWCRSPQSEADLAVRTDKLVSGFFIVAPRSARDATFRLALIFVCVGPRRPLWGGRGKGPARQAAEGEVGGAVVRKRGKSPPHPTLSAHRAERGIFRPPRAVRSVHLPGAESRGPGPRARRWHPCQARAGLWGACFRG